MSDVTVLEFIESELKSGMEYLSRVSEEELAVVQEARRNARRCYDNIMDLLPKVALSGKRRVDFLTKLAGFRSRLILAGEELGGAGRIPHSSASLSTCRTLRARSNCV